MAKKSPRVSYRLPIRRVTTDDRKIDHVSTVGPGELAYPTPHGGKVVRARLSAMTKMDEEAAQEGRAVRDLDQTDANGVRQNRVRR